MKKVLFSVVLCLTILLSVTSVSAQESAQDKAYREALVEMLDASGSMVAVKAVVPQLISLMRYTYSNVPASYWDELEKQLSGEANTRFIDMYVPIYKRYLNLNDLKKITAFYKSPVGKKLAEATPMMSAEAMQAGQQLGQEISLEIMGRLEKEGFIEE